MATMKKQIRRLQAGDILPNALRSGALRVTGLEIHERSPNGATFNHTYRVSAVWVSDGQPIAGLLGMGGTTLDVEIPEVK